MRQYAVSPLFDCTNPSMTEFVQRENSKPDEMPEKI